MIANARPNRAQMLIFPCKPLISLSICLPFLSSFCRKHAWMRAPRRLARSFTQSYPHDLWVTRRSYETRGAPCDGVVKTTSVIIATHIVVEESFVFHHTSGRLADLAPDCVFHLGPGPDH
jgi:hypothetical protein